MMYKDEIVDLEAIAASLSQGLRGFEIAQTKLGIYVESAINDNKLDGVDIPYLISALIQILEFMNLKGKWLRYFKIGKIVFNAIINIRRKKSGEVYKRINRFFHLYEFVDFKTLKQEDALCLIDERIINIASYIREHTGRAVIVNTYMWGGRFSQRGYRHGWSNVGTNKSMHRVGKALDFNVAGWSTAQVHAFIKTNEAHLYRLGVRRVENAAFTPTWTHIDLKDTGKDKIYFFNP